MDLDKKIKFVENNAELCNLTVLFTFDYIMEYIWL